MQIVSFLKQKVTEAKNRKNWPYIFFALFILTLFLINTLHESYPDEFDTILGGWYGLQGGLIYKDWFTHHGPIAYFLASFIEIFSGRSFVGFRIFYALFLFCFTFFSFSYLRSSVRNFSLNFYLGFILLFGVGATYFWGHMALADNIAAIFLTPVFGLVVLKMYTREFFSIRDFIFISILTSLALLTSITYIFLILSIYFFLAVYYLSSYDYKVRNMFNNQTYKIVGIFLAPFIAFFLYLLLTGSLSDFIYQAITFNKKYYVYYPGSSGEVTINPLRFAIIIAQEFHNNFSSLLIQVKSFEFAFPFNITLAVANTGLLIFLIFRKKYALALFVLSWLIYSNGRSNPWTSRETDYQSAVYIMASLFNITFLIPTLYQELKKDIEYPKKLILSFVFIIVLIYSFFNGAFLLRKFSYKAYDKYMGRAALIYDRPRLAPIINAITTKEDFAMIGPFEFEENLYLNARQPSKYHILLPGMGSSERIQQELISDLNKNKPTVIYFDKRYFILGRSPETYGQFFLDFLNNNYVTLSQYTEGKTIYKSKIPIDDKVDPETKLYIDRDKAPRVVQSLLDRDIIEKAQ